MLFIENKYIKNILAAKTVDINVYSLKRTKKAIKENRVIKRARRSKTLNYKKSIANKNYCTDRYCWQAINLYKTAASNTNTF